MKSQDLLIEKTKRWLSRRNGIDILGRDICCLSLLINPVNLFIKSDHLSMFAQIGFFYALFRAFSSNKVKRGIENQRYLAHVYKTRDSFIALKNRAKDRKEHKYLKCPNCHQKLRVPRRQGKIEVHCPKCGKTFDTRS